MILVPPSSCSSSGRKMTDGDPANKELSLMDKQITSLLDVTLKTFLQSVNLHCNQISKIEGLARLCRLQHLDLSSNLITRIEGLDSLICLQSLNLSCNKLTKIEGLQKLLNLKNLNLSYNRIHDLSGLILLHGQNHKLSHLYLHSNCIQSMDRLLQSMAGLHSLAHLTLQQHGKGNPVCFAAGYRDMVFGNLPQLQSLDSISKSGDIVPKLDMDPRDLPNLDFLEYLITSDNDTGIQEIQGNPVKPRSSSRDYFQKDEPTTTSWGNPVQPNNSSRGYLEKNGPMSTSLDCTSSHVPTPRIDQVLLQYRKRPITQESGIPVSSTDAISSSEREFTKKPDTANSLREMRIKKLEEQISELLLKASHPKADKPERAMKPKRDTDLTTESDWESGKENVKTGMSRRSKIPASSKKKQTPKQQAKTRTSASMSDQSSSCKQRSPSPHRKVPSAGSISSERTDKVPARFTRSVRPQQRKMEGPTTSTVEESTYRALVQELDQERERRWKAEQLAVKLTDSIKELQSQAKEEKEINSMAVYTTDRIKELLVKEKNEKSTLQALLHQLKEENERLIKDIKKSAIKEEEYQQAIRKMEDELSKLETQRIQREALEMKHIQEVERKVSASQREIELLRASLHQHKDKVQQLQELLTSREQTHRQELETRVTVNGPEFHQAVAKELSKAEHCHNQQIRELQEKLGLLTQQYADLEDEFRTALVIEAGRFKEVKDAFDSVTAQLAEHKEALSCSRQKEKQSANLIQELTTVVKEQKARIADLTKAKQELARDLKNKIRNQEMVIEDEKQKTLQIQLLKQDKCKLISQLTAQESLIDGLKAERKIWGQELTQQGVSLAQDRGRLEAKIEVLSTEIEALKKQNERDNDALKIKTKMVDDQTETIRKLKEGLQERDERIRKLHGQNLEMEKALGVQNDERAIQLQELKEKLQRQTERKGEIKLQLEEREAELEDVKKAYSAMNKKWRDKAELLSQLETQVRQMKENFDAKEKRLTEERDKSLHKQKVVMEKLHSVDDAFRRQLESILTAHQAELIKVASEKQKEIEAANDRVYKVEEEMRQLLQETATSKRGMEEKIKRLTSALSDIQEDF